jgi:large subunit ribosomal protein L13
MNKKFANPLWHLVDARDQVLGRLATQIVKVIRGKHKPNFCPNYDCGDYVVVINAAEVKLTGDKKKQKFYKWHTGYPGGLKQKSVEQYLNSKPEEVKTCFPFSLTCII